MPPKAAAAPAPGKKDDKSAKPDPKAKAGGKGGGAPAPADNSLSLSNIRLVRQPLAPPSSTSLSPLHMRTLLPPAPPFAIKDLSDVLPAWSDATVSQAPFWETPVPNYLKGRSAEPQLTLPRFLAAQSLASAIKWVPASHVGTPFLEVKPPTPEEIAAAEAAAAAAADPKKKGKDAKGDADKKKSDDKKKADDKKGKKGAEAVAAVETKVWEEVLRDEESGTLLPRLVNHEAPKPIDPNHMLTLPQPPKPVGEGEAVAVAVAASATSISPADTPASTEPVPVPAPPAPVPLIPHVQATTCRGWCAALPRGIAGLELRRALSVEQARALREGAAVPPLDLAAAAAPEDTSANAPALPTNPKEIIREGGVIDPILAGVFKSIGMFRGSFPEPPPPPPVDEEGNVVATDGYTPPESSTPFLWEAIYPQNAHRRPVYNVAGKYAVKVFFAGAWRMLEVDDSVPVDDLNEPLFPIAGDAIGRSAAIWPSILAKAVYTLWDASGARDRSESTPAADELSETANFAAFALHTLTGWLPSAIGLETDTNTLSSLGVHVGTIADYLPRDPAVDAFEAKAPERDSPMKKLAKIMSPKKKSKNRKNRRPPPPQPNEVENALRSSQNRINEIKKKMMAAKAGETVVVFRDSWQNIKILPILAVAKQVQSEGAFRLRSSSPSPPASPDRGGAGRDGAYSPTSDTEAVGFNKASPRLSLGVDSYSETPLLLLSWDCPPPTHAPYNAQGVIPTLPVPPTPNMLWMSAGELFANDCRIVHMSTMTDLKGPSSVWRAPLSDSPLNEDGSSAGKRVSNLAPVLLKVDVNSIQPKRLTPDGPPRIIIAGPPAGGKGTQCEFIKTKYGVVHLSTGDMLRQAVADQTPVGLQAKACMEAGQLVSDEIITNVVIDRLKMDDCKSAGWLLDGFPRTKAQADSLVAACNDPSSGILPPDVFLLLDVPSSVLVERVCGRRMDPVTGKIYHLTFSPPESEEIAARLTQRSDDTEEAIVVRIDTFNAQLNGVLGSFNQSIVKKVLGTGDKDTISEHVLRSVSDSISPPKVAAKLHLCLFSNAYDFSVAAANAAKVAEEEKKEPEMAGEEGISLSSPFSSLLSSISPLYKNAVATIQDYYDPSIRFSVRVPTTSSLACREIVVPVDPASSGLFSVSLSAPFGATIQAASDAPVKIGDAAAIFPANASSFVAEDAGEVQPQRAGEFSVIFRRVVAPASPATCNFYLHVEDVAISSCVSLCAIDNASGAVTRFPTLSVKKFKLDGSAGITIVATLNNKVCDAPAFSWRFLALSDGSLLPASSDAAADEGLNSSARSLASQGCEMKAFYGGAYTPNKYDRLFRDIISTSKEGGPLSLRLMCKDNTVSMRLKVWDANNPGLCLLDVRGCSAITLLSVNVPHPPTPEEPSKLIVEATIDGERMVIPAKYLSDKPYYFLPDASKEGALEWGFEVTSAAPVVVSNDMAQLDYEESVRNSWETEQPGRAARADVLRAQGANPKPLTMPTFDENGVLVTPGVEKAGDKKGGKKADPKKGTASAAEDAGVSGLPEKNEQGHYDEEALMTLVARAAALKIDVKLEAARHAVKENMIVGASEPEDSAFPISIEVVEDDGGSSSIFTEFDVQARAESSTAMLSASMQQVQDSADNIVAEVVRSKAELEQQFAAMKGERDAFESVMGKHYYDREAYRLKKVAEEEAAAAAAAALEAERLAKLEAEETARKEAEKAAKGKK